MALRTSYGDRNLVIDEGLCVRYSTATISGSWTYVGGVSIVTVYEMQECHRYATKRFRYVGMTYAAALKCRNDMIDKFTRDIYRSVWSNGAWARAHNGKLLTADVHMTPAGADAYDVEVSVNEDDSRLYRVQEPFVQDRAFYYESQRTYGSDAHGNADETEQIPET